MSDCHCGGRFIDGDGWTVEHGKGQCIMTFNKDDYMPPLPNLLDGTTEFMRRARQLETAGRSDMWPVNMPEGLRELRMRMLTGPEGEVQEYLDAEANDDLVEVVDGLLDVIVIAWGTLLAYVGEDRAKAATTEVVRSNLAKVIGEGLPIFRDDGKVLKPPGWTPPDIAGAIA